MKEGIEEVLRVLPNWWLRCEKPCIAASLGHSGLQRTSSTLPVLVRSFLALHDF